VSSSKAENFTKFKLIAAISDNDVIGLEDGGLPWVLPGDLRHFKEITQGNTILMGWKTWQSIGELPLPGRVNIILSRKPRKLPRSKWIRHIRSPMEIHSLPKKWIQGDIFIIGGGQVYQTYAGAANEMFLTFVHVNVPNEEKCIKFPHIDWTKWKVDASSEEIYDSESKITYEFKHYVRSL